MNAAEALIRAIFTSGHRCANCYVAQYGMKSDVPCRNEWWSRWDAENTKDTQ